MVDGIKVIRYGRRGPLEHIPVNYAASSAKLALDAIERHLARNEANYVTVAGRACFTLYQAELRVAAEVNRLEQAA